MHTFTFSSTLRSAALVAMVALGACSKKDDDTPTPAVTTYNTTWTADGKSYTSTTSTGTVSNSMLAISAAQAVSSTENYGITLSVPAAAGTYNLANSTSYGSYTTSVGSTSNIYLASLALPSTSGTVTVSTFSATEIIGTFSFTGSTIVATGTGATKAVTNGKFAIKR